MSYQPRSTNPYIMEKKLNNCVGGGGFDPSVLEEIEAEISVLGSENATMAQDIINIKGSLNSLNDNLSKTTISNDTKVTLTKDTEYTTLADGYFRIYGPLRDIYVTGYIDNVVVMQLLPKDSTSSGASLESMSIFVRKGSKIKYESSSTLASGTFFPLS